jgi:outer membrane protein OmpA-like peptidoglycan-associated protein
MHKTLLLFSLLLILPSISHSQSSIGSMLLFDSNEKTLNQEHISRLSKVLDTLAIFESYSIKLLGHTDDLGNGDYNLELSKTRAEAVRNYLLENGIMPENIQMRFFGELQPLFLSAKPEARKATEWASQIVCVIVRNKNR